MNMEPRERMLRRRATLLALVASPSVLLAPTPRVRACDMVCVADDRYESMLGRYTYVLVGRVEARTETPAGSEFRVKAIRVWNGKSTIALRNTGGMCGKSPTVGRVYVVFASTDPQDIDMCSPVMAVSEDRARQAITRLDRARHFPPLSLPQEDLGRE